MAIAAQTEHGTLATPGARLRASRLSAKLSVEEAASKAGCSRLTWYDWEKDKCLPRDVRVLEDYAKDTHVPLAWIIWGEGEKPAFVLAAPQQLKRGPKPKKNKEEPPEDDATVAALQTRIAELQQLVTEQALEIARLRRRQP
jgi:transcriptional regulator with XRE-family HTH domain